MKKIITTLSILSLVQVAGAQQVLNNVETIVTKSSGIIGSGVTGLLMGVTFVVFLISIITFLLKRRSGDDKGLQDAKNMLGWSVIAMFVMVAVWGLVTFISQTFNIGLGGQVARPSAIPIEKNSNQPGDTPGSGLGAVGSVCSQPSDCLSGKCTAAANSSIKTCD